MKYILEDLLRIRGWREEKAQREVTKKKLALDQALQLAAARRKSLSDHVHWRLQTEDRLYREIEGKSVQLRDLEDIKLKVALMREDEAAHEKALQESEGAATTAGKALEEARSLYRLAVKETRKVEEHKKVWLAEALKGEEREAEKELEDFVPRSEQSDEEWGADYENI